MRFFTGTLLFCSICLLVALVSCKQDQNLFEPISSKQSNIHFQNSITETDSVNVLDLSNVYNGGGVGIGDFNNDGLAGYLFYR